MDAFAAHIRGPPSSSACVRAPSRGDGQIRPTSGGSAGRSTLLRLPDEPGMPGSALTGFPTASVTCTASSTASPSTPLASSSRPGSGQRPQRASGLARLPPDDPGRNGVFACLPQQGSRPNSGGQPGTLSSDIQAASRKASLSRLPDAALPPAACSAQSSPASAVHSSSDTGNPLQATFPPPPIGDVGFSLPGCVQSDGMKTSVGANGPCGSVGAPTLSPLPLKQTGLSAVRDRFRKELSVAVGLPDTGRRHEVFKLLANGDSISNHYTFTEEIYSGGAKGKVVAAKRVSDGVEVIVKIRTKQSNGTGERTWRAIMAQVHQLRGSCHILEINEILEDDRAFYVVMPKCEGGELFEFLVTETEVPEAECKRIIREILIAVGHLHKQGLVHRDVKPENIMFDLKRHEGTITTPKTVKLIDFDTCVEWTPASPKSCRFVGTPGYIAPEALLGEITPQSDLWSVGVILYILMTGETPWSSMISLEDGTVGSPGARRMYQALKTEVVEWDREPWPDFPLARDLCQVLMAFDVRERACTVQEALNHQWLTGESCSAAPPADSEEMVVSALQNGETIHDETLDVHEGAGV